MNALGRLGVSFTRGALACRLPWPGLLLIATVGLLPGCGPAIGGSDGAAATVPVRTSDAAAPLARSRKDNLPAAGELRERIDSVLAITQRRHLNPKVQSAWQIVHGILAFGRDLQMEMDGNPVSALDAMLAGRPVQGWNLEPGAKGLDAILEAGSKTGQGHEDQWIGYLSQCGLTMQDNVTVAGETYTVADMVAQAQWDVRENMEATWTLMAFGKYLPLDAEWQAKDGSRWNIERLVQLEARQPIVGEACGGTHRLYALAKAVNRRREARLPMSGGWAEAESKVQEHIDIARKFQQADGAFSTRHFERPGTSPDVGLRIGTTGHILEFLVVAVPRDELGEPWLVRSVDYLCALLAATDEVPVECGGLYHAAHGLRLYRDLRFGTE